MYETTDISGVSTKDIPESVKKMADIAQDLRGDIYYIRVVKSTGSIELYTEDGIKKEIDLL